MNIEQLLRSRNLKITPQRTAILGELQRLGHATIEEVYERIRYLYPSLSLATVYKNLSSLQEVNVVDEVKIPNQKQHYEIAKDPHVHLVCQQCGEIRDLLLPCEELQQQCVENSGYYINRSCIAFMGLCPECQQKSDNLR
ncbi:transcriptional repressor [Helicobacter monodelphidis]|uniref:Fur family transcriptional regulator n=1 Tax=Helicobacter sp. 15-1451 TaxID=2004995 RepID=UPI000DCBAA63|nr:Fur family transcriptional regulator [Helicobacter sp. 15-1451]RAX58196.1 transcriptional repressor [Helicobacter sp. 15-1451]